MAKFCKKCGTKIDDDERFCSECGHETGNVSGNAVTPVYAPVPVKKAGKSRKEKPKKKKRTLLKLIAILLALLIATSGVIGALTYFNLIDIPFVSSFMRFVGILDSESVAVGGKYADIQIAANVVIDNVLEEDIVITEKADHWYIASDVAGYIYPFFNFYCAEDFSKATISFEYDKDLAEEDAQNLAIFYFDEDDLSFTELENQTRVGNTISAEVTHFSYYGLFDNTPRVEALKKHQQAFQLTQGADLTDSNKDGIPDIYLDLIIKGILIDRNGRKFFQGVSTEDVLKKGPDYDNDGVINGDEIIPVRDERTKRLYLEYRSDPMKWDTDGDGANDYEDLSPLKPFVTPVIFLHGRTDNTESCFGLVTDIPKGKNAHYNADASIPDYKEERQYIGNMLAGVEYIEIDGTAKSYTEASSHRIREVVPNKGDKTPINLGYYLVHNAKEHYEANKNLFAFNYPNEDMTRLNAQKFTAYLYDLADTMSEQSDEVENMFYPTREAKRNQDYKVVLIGHSNGGLVSRYFIENMGGSSVVTKLITIDTPHWGSDLARNSVKIDLSAFKTALPMDFDLHPEGRIFTGEASYYTPTSSWNTGLDEKLNYINRNQTDQLNRTRGRTKYYFIAGYDLEMGKLENTPVHSSIYGKPLFFDVNMDNVNTFGDYKASVQNGFLSKSEYTAYGDNKVFKSVVLDFGYKVGDNVVELSSQFGLQFSAGANDGSIITDSQKVIADKYFLTMDTFWGHSWLVSFDMFWNGQHFHGQNQHRTETAEKVLEYLRDDSSDAEQEATDVVSQRTTSDERDIVLVLDTSGSMDGTPLNETRKASVNFIDTILKEDASIGIVEFSSGASVVSDFSMNQLALETAAKNAYSGGSTNTDAGLSTAHEMLQNSNAKKKIIVLMSDGQPNQGRTGQALIDYAGEIKKEGIYIYTLGFFHDLSGSSKVAAQDIMGAIASDGCHYEVDDAGNLVFFFGDIADQINGQEYIYVRIACPVNVTVSHNGETLSSSEKDLNTRTAFGSLTFEENKNNENDKIKILRLKADTEYDIQIAGYARGKMDYTIGFMDEDGKYSDFRRFRGVPITRSTVIDTVAKTSGVTMLNVDEDGDGKYDLRYRAGVNEYGELVDYSYIYYIVIGVVAVMGVLVFALVIRKRVKAKRNKS